MALRLIRECRVLCMRAKMRFRVTCAHNSSSFREKRQHAQVI